MAPYIAITAHWMNKNDASHLELKSALIAFTQVSGKHTASNLANVVIQLLDRAGTTTNVCSHSVFHLQLKHLNPLLVRPFHTRQPGD